jgi:putative Holliday junction resolvase
MTAKFLGIDYGTKRIGVALSDERGTLAFPSAILDNDAKVLPKLGDMIKKENIGGIVVGESLDFKGQPNAVAADIEIFIAELGKFGTPVRKEKEFLTSVEARRFQGSKNKVDSSAAALILQRYLDRRNLKAES